jgi:predicted ATP-grasp superfamily ATP-dependent carboligase
MENAIILDGELKSALATVRSLGSAGIFVSAGATRASGMALHSRFTGAHFIYPSPYTHQREFVDAVKREAIRLGGKPVVYALSDATYLSLFMHKDELMPHMTLIFPEKNSIDIAYDKAATYSLARVSGIPTIPTHTPVTEEELSLLGETLAYPAVVKTRRSVTWKDGKGIFGSASFVQNKGELKNKFHELEKNLGEAPLVQNFMQGEEYGVEMLAKEGSVYARVTHHRLRSLSPTGGASVLKETMGASELTSALETHADRLVKELAWTGPVMVEFKVDSDTRKPYLMEINGRFWGSLPLSAYSGVDMPLLFYRHAREGTVPTAVVTGRENVTSNHFFGDVRHLLKVFFAHDPMRTVLYPERMKAFRDFLQLPKGTYSDVWSLDDPKPAFMEIIDIIKR